MRGSSALGSDEEALALEELPSYGVKNSGSRLFHFLLHFSICVSFYIRVTQFLLSVSLPVIERSSKSSKEEKWVGKEIE